MKKTRKIIGLVLAAVLLVSASVMGTIAYLTAKDTVTNTFTVGSVAIVLDEAKVDENGLKIEGAARVDANTYKLLPGHKYDKDPTIHVGEGSEDCWLFVKVENGLADIEAGTTIAAQMEANGWTLVAGTSDIYGRTAPAKAGDNVEVFENFEIKGAVGSDALVAYADKTIVVTAYAIQKDGFATAKDAWDTAKLA